jgi:hypothetical protein
MQGEDIPGAERVKLLPWLGVLSTVGRRRSRYNPARCLRSGAGCPDRALEQPELCSVGTISPEALCVGRTGLGRQVMADLGEYQGAGESQVDIRSQGVVAKMTRRRQSALAGQRPAFRRAPCPWP